MKQQHKTLRVLYNGSRSSLQPEKVIAQGGPSRFADSFKNFFKKQKYCSIVPFLFTDNLNTKVPFIRSTTVDGNVFKELVYSNNLLLRTIYDKNPKRSQLLKEIKPLLRIIEDTITEEQIDIIFLNGYSVTNWFLLYVAHRKKIPVVIQHAGILKNEISRKKSLSSATRKIFYQMERDTVRWCSHHIFLNEFSRETFINLYNITKRDCFPSSIVPLPIPSIGHSKNFKEYNISAETKIGMVARWDSIKNHAAMLRLATAPTRPAKWSFHTVVNIPQSSNVFTFPKKYKAAIYTHRPMSPEELTSFYRSMDIIFVPSNFDVSPTVVAEAFLAGTPVIISNKVGWQDEFIACGLGDHIIATDSPGNAMVKIISAILLGRNANIKRYQSLAKYIRLNHAPSVVLKEYEILFRKITNGV